MAKNNVSEYDILAANNTDISGNNITGSGLISTADDSFRANSANLAKWWDDLGGVNTVAGTGDAITITTPTVYTALKTGMRLEFKASAVNTTAVTLNLDAIGAKAVRKISGGTDVALVAGDIPGANFRAEIVYDAAANAAAGAWVLITTSIPNPLSLTGSTVAYTPFQGVSTEAAAAAGPILDLYRNSASPAVNDFIAEIDLTGQNSTPAKKTYASIGARIDDATAASEDATLILAAMKAGTLTNYLTPGANAAGTATANAVGFPLGQMSFPATQNPSSDVNTLDDYEELDTTPTVTASSGTFTTVSCSLLCTKVGRLVTFTGKVIVTTAGTAAGNMIVPLPYTAAQDGGGSGAELPITGNALAIAVVAGASSFTIAKYDGLTIIGSGRTYRFSGSFIPA